MARICDCQSPHARDFTRSIWDNGWTNKDGPERGVCTSGRGLADASKGVD